MKDRFKFRAYNRKTKKLIYDVELINKRFVEFVEDKNIVLMQSTGVEDKNGKLIYEGDILKVINGSINGIGLSDKWEVKWVGDGWNIKQWSFDSTHYYEVIGNIYENKDLLGVE